MKRERYIFTILTTLIFLLSGCSKTKENLVSWTPICPQVDSINSQLEDDFEQEASDSIKIHHIERLCSIAENYPENLTLQSRMHFWKGRHYNRRFQRADASRELVLAKKFCDSASSPYDQARIEHEILNASEDVAAKYFREIRLLDYFTSINDSAMVGYVCNSLSVIFRNLNDTVNYRKYLQMADDLFLKTGHNRARLLCLINSTDLYGKEAADSILNIIRQTPGVEKMQYLYYIALYNSFLYTDKVEYLETLLSLIRDDTTQQEGRWHTQALIAINDFTNHRNLDRAIAYSKESYEHLNDSLPLVMQSKIREAYAHYMLKNGNQDSAMSLLNTAHDIYIRYLDEHRSGKMITDDVRERIEKEKKILEKEQSLDRTRYFFIVGVILLFALIIFGIFYFVLHNMRMKKKWLENELTVNRKSLAASKLVTSTKSQLIDEVAQAVEQMKTEGTMTEQRANSLLTSLKIHANAKEELDSFQRIHESLHPKFTVALGERCPGISEGMIRLASYIAMGYTNQQIADMLGISHGTVNKNRYRLRMKLRLQRNESLEHCLRTLCPEESVD